MPDLLLHSFAPLLLAFQPCFTQPSFRSFGAVACAWILCSGRRSLTRIIHLGGHPKPAIEGHFKTHQR